MERGAAAAKKKNGSKASARASGGASRGRPPRSAAPVVPMDEVLAANVALRDALASLGATTPRYVTGKQLHTSDVHGNQARLLFSCKSGGPGPSPSRHPLAACFTALEAARVADRETGLLVTALDGRGRRHDITCKYLDCNHAYRFIAGWKRFVEANGLNLRGGESAIRRDVRVEVWAFRSRELDNGYVDSTKKEKVREETGHPYGALGFVLLHYENNAAVGVDAGEDEEGMVVDEKPTMPAAAAPPVTRQEDLAGAAEQWEAAAATRAMSKDEMVAKFGEKMAFAAIGMNMLRMGSWGRN